MRIQITSFSTVFRFYLTSRKDTKSKTADSTKWLTISTRHTLLDYKMFSVTSPPRFDLCFFLQAFHTNIFCVSLISPYSVLFSLIRRHSLHNFLLSCYFMLLTDTNIFSVLFSKICCSKRFESFRTRSHVYLYRHSKVS